MTILLGIIGLIALIVISGIMFIFRLSMRVVGFIITAIVLVIALILLAMQS